MLSMMSSGLKISLQIKCFPLLENSGLELYVEILNVYNI